MAQKPPPDPYPLFQSNLLSLHLPITYTLATESHTLLPFCSKYSYVWCCYLQLEYPRFPPIHLANPYPFFMIQLSRYLL